MTKTILKRIALPRAWSVPRKSLNGSKRKFVSRPNSGKDFETTVTINTLMKEVLSLARTKREVKYILRTKEVLVNGNRIKDERFPVGLFDIITFPIIEKSYRMTLNEFGRIGIIEIDSKESTLVMKKVVGKSLVKGGKQQINLFGSGNIISGEKIAIGDVVIIENKKIKSVIRLEKGSKVLMTGGRHAGKIGTVKEIVDSKIFISVDGIDLETLTKYAYVFADSENVVTVR